MHGDFPADHPFSHDPDHPGDPGAVVHPWLVGLRRPAGRKLGLPYAFAHHFAGAGGNTGAALDLYRSLFRPSEVLAEPYPMIGVSALAADTEEEAALPGPGRGAVHAAAAVRPAAGDPYPGTGRGLPVLAGELDLFRAMGRTEVVGSAEQVAAGLDELAERFGVREMIISTRAHGQDAKLRSMELIAMAYRAVRGRPVAARTAAVFAASRPRSELCGAIVSYAAAGPRVRSGG